MKPQKIEGLPWEGQPADLRADRAGIGFPVGQSVIEVKTLQKYAKKVKHWQIIVEIGTRNGGSALVLSQASVVPVITLDILEDPREPGYGYGHIPPLREHWDSFPGGYKIEFYPVGSLGYVHDPNDSLGLVFIDGGHEYEQIKDDWNHFWPILDRGGYCLVHDYEVFPGVTKFLNELEMNPIDRGGSILVYRK